MALAALCAWLIAAVAGGRLLVSWLAQGGVRRQATKVTRFPTVVLLGHPVLALGGMLDWVLYLATARPCYAWTAFAALVVVALLGFVMLTRWLVAGGGRHARGGEQPFPARAVLVHILVALTTFVLVLATATLASRR